MDILRLRPSVVGDLANSNNDTLLAANLNRTFRVLDNPARVITINFETVDFDWTKNFIFEESKKELKQIVLEREHFDGFLKDLNGTWRKNWKDVNYYLYQRKGQEIKENTNDATFIFSYLAPSFTSKG